MTFLLSFLFLMLSGVLQSQAASHPDFSDLDAAQNTWRAIASTGNPQEIKAMQDDMKETLAEAWANYMHAQLSAGLLEQKYQPDPDQQIDALMAPHQANPEKLINVVCEKWQDLLDQIAQVEALRDNPDAMPPPLQKKPEGSPKPLLLTWQQYDALVEKWSRTVTATQNGSLEDREDTFDQVTGEIKEHLIPLIASLQDFRKKKYEASSRMKWPPKCPQPAHMVANLFLQNKWTNPTPHSFSRLKSTFHNLVRKQALPFHPDGFEVYRQLVKEWARQIETAPADQYTQVTQHVYGMAAQRLRLVMMSHQELQDQVQGLRLEQDGPYGPKDQQVPLETPKTLLERLDINVLQGQMGSPDKFPRLIAKMFRTRLLGTFREFLKKNDELLNLRNVLLRPPPSTPEPE